MKVDKIRRLFDALDQSTHRNTRKVQAPKVEAEAPRGNQAPAVKLASDLQRPVSDAARDVRAEKVDRIAKQVKEGGYKPSSREVSVALLRDLF